MRKNISLHSKTMGACVFGLFLISFTSFSMPVSYAEQLTYDEKLEFMFKTEQIVGHMISALDNIIQEEYGLAKMHLVHPSAEHSDLIDFLSEDSECSQKFPLVLTMLQATDPEFDIQITDQRFSYVFQVLRDCNAMAGVDADSNLNFNIDLIDKILEKSVSEYELSSHLTGYGRIMEYQDGLALVMRAHMLFNSSDIFDSKQNIQIIDNFKELFSAYQNGDTPDEIAYLTNQLRNEIRTLNGSTVFSDSVIRYDLITPTVYLKGLDYSTELLLLELRGENFDTDKKIMIEYVSPVGNTSETLRGTVTSDGQFHFPLEFINTAFDEPIMFTITVGDSIFFEILTIS